MKPNTRNLKTIGALGSMLLSASALLGQSIGQWDFESGTLSQTSGSNLGDLVYRDGNNGATKAATQFGTTTSFGIPDIGGTPAKVMKFAAGAPGTGYLMPTPPGNGGGSQCNNYTILLDVLYPVNGNFRPLVQNDDGNLDNILCFFAVGANNSLQATNTAGTALPSVYAGTLQSNTWYRVGFSVDQTDGEIDFYTNGVKAGVLRGIGGFRNLDNPYALLASAQVHLLSSSITNAAGYANSVQVRDSALNAGQMAALGAPSAAGIPITIPPVHTFVASQLPDVGAVDISPLPVLNVTLNQGDSTLDQASLKVLVDGTIVPADLTDLGGGVYSLDYTTTNLLSPLSVHRASVVYKDSFSSPGFITNSWTFTIANYQVATLPATALYSENFDLVAEGGLPAGWVATNWTDTLTAGLNLDDTASDSYKDWVTIDVGHYMAVYGDTDTYKSPGQPVVSGNRRTMIPPIVLNGELLTGLASGNLIVAESDQRDGNQVQVLFTSDYDLTAKTNVYLSFFHLNEQNQDNISSVEYSIDHGATWLPLLYMLDDGTTDGNGSDVVTNATTGQIDVFATFNTARTDQAHGLAFGAFIGAPVATNLIPFIRPCRNDDDVQQKRIEILRAVKADGQSSVRFRFMQAGTGSWFFDMDNFAIYSINTPVISTQPQSLTVDANTPATFAVAASGKPPLTYQWKFNGVNIAGATNASYTISNALPVNVGQYLVVITNPDGPTTSSPASLGVNTTPLISAQVIGQVADAGSTVTLTGTGTGGRPLTYLWYRNGNLVTTTTSGTLTLNNVQPANSGSYSFTVTNLYGSVSSVPAGVQVYAGPLTSNLVVHLTFDGDLLDTSGRGNDAQYQFQGAGSTTPNFLTGQMGQAFQFNVLKDSSSFAYATLGYPLDLQFGDTNDFTVSMWVNYTNQNDDLPFISNKDWNSSNNQGWGIFTQSGGNYRVNVTGPNRGADKFDVSPAVLLRDGKWHNVVVSFIHAPFLQSAYVYNYVDGVLVNQKAMNLSGTVDTSGIPFTHTGGPAAPLQSAFAINIGEDGSGVYTDGGSAYNINALVDDLGIWRRALTSNEAKAIYSAGLSGKSLAQAVAPVTLSYTVSGGVLHFTWAGSPTVKLQQSSSLKPAVWTDVSGTLGASSANVPISGNGNFFKLAQ